MGKHTESKSTKKESRETPEASLVAALMTGDEGAAETLVRTHAPWMVAVAKRVLGDHALAEDCVSTLR